ncbi:hypothetical protein [Nostoc sp. NMS4]|uniref:hypothetical protein n=1 Tax=Nostoc sp. NMS4 TaxID=2815390 RepID=UPI0025EF26FF|nr:hypothetical protein [Nostoc sp. NMS4]MBN3924151.1 hypothetical protein [Nostoc sp. NMS4]
MSNSSNINSNSIPDKLESGKNREQIFQEFLVLANSPDATADNPALLYKGVQNSPVPKTSICNLQFSISNLLSQSLL